MDVTDKEKTWPQYLNEKGTRQNKRAHNIAHKL